MNRLFLCPPFFVALVACPPPVQCPGGGVPVVVTLTQSGGTFTDEAAVSFVMDDDDPVSCSSVGEGKYHCGTDESGSYDIIAVVQGREDVKSTVEVGFDECRIVSETVSLEVGAPCEARDVTSVHVLVEDAADSAPLPGAIVKYRAASDGGGMELCDDAEELNGYNCGVNLAGEIRVTALHGGYEGLEKKVLVTQGTCYVETAELTIQLDKLEE